MTGRYCRSRDSVVIEDTMWIEPQVILVILTTTDNVEILNKLICKRDKCHD